MPNCFLRRDAKYVGVARSGRETKCNRNILYEKNIFNKRKINKPAEIPRTTIRVAGASLTLQLLSLTQRTEYFLLTNFW